MVVFTSSGKERCPLNDWPEVHPDAEQTGVVRLNETHENEAWGEVTLTTVPFGTVPPCGLKNTTAVMAGDRVSVEAAMLL